MLSLANVFPDACAELYEAFKAGNLEEAEKLNTKLVDLNKKVSGFGGWPPSRAPWTRRATPVATRGITYVR